MKNSQLRSDRLSAGGFGGIRRPEIFEVTVTNGARG